MQRTTTASLATQAILIIYMVFNSEPVWADCAPYFRGLVKKSHHSTNCEEQHLTTLGSGNTSPSTGSLLTENPTGLFYNRLPKVLLSASKLSASDFDPWKYNMSFVTGNGTIGAGLGAFNYQGQLQGNNLNVLAYGTGLKLEFLNAAIGLSGFSVFSGLSNLINQSDEGFNANFGMIYNPEGDYRLGITIYDFLDQDTTWGIGVATFLGESAAFVLDLTSSPAFDGANSTRVYNLKPSLGINLSRFQLSANYGIQLNDGDSVPTIVENLNRSGLALGLSMQLFGSTSLIAYYNRLELYYLGILMPLFGSK